MSQLEVTPHAHDFAARVEAIDLSGALSKATVSALRELWLKYQILYFPNQPLRHDELERFTSHFGEYGNDPYVKAIDGHPNVLEIRREPD